MMMDGAEMRRTYTRLHDAGPLVPPFLPTTALTSTRCNASEHTHMPYGLGLHIFPSLPGLLSCLPLPVATMALAVAMSSAA